MKSRKHFAVAAIIAAGFLGAGAAQAVPVTVTKLSGLTGGTPALTAVFLADLSSVGIGTIQSITIRDNSLGLGGAPGQFTAFDLDAIILSNTLCATAACVAALTPLSVFDYTGGSIFSPGTQRTPVDPKLFGTGPIGNTVDNAVATLGLFDGNASTATPFGFISLGDNGVITFNLTSALSTSGLYMYFGEVGDNGEAAASDITISQNPVGVPEPDSLVLLALGLGLILVLGLVDRRAPGRLSRRSGVPSGK